MEVILMKSVEGLGTDGDVVRVADGYARNYLIPRGLAEPVTVAARRRWERQRATRAAEEAARLQAAKDLARRISETSVTIRARAGAENKLFGSVMPAHIADALKLQGIEVDRHAVDLPEPIRELGVFKVAVKLAPDVEAQVKVWVVEE